MLFCVVLCCSVLFCVVLSCSELFCVVLWCSMFFFVLLQPSNLNRFFVVDEDNCGCRQKEVVTGAEYNVYHIKKGTRVKKVDPRDVNNPSEFQVDGLDKVNRYKNTNVALEFAFKRPLLMSAIGFTTTPNNVRIRYICRL